MAAIRDGAVVGIGGALTASHPMALVRALTRHGARELTVVSPTAGLDVDLLVAAGRVGKVVTAYLGAEDVAPVGPVFRQAVERGHVKLWEADESHCMLALRAAAQGLPFLPWRGGVGTDLPRLNPELVPFQDPLKGEELLAVPAMPLDVALISAECADVYGNVQFADTGHLDRLLAAAADRVIVQVERIVSTEVIRRDPGATCFWPRTSVVCAPWGTHPFSSASLDADATHLAHYAACARKAARDDDTQALDGYLQRFVFAAVDHMAYLEQIGIRRIAELRI